MPPFRAVLAAVLTVFLSTASSANPIILVAPGYVHSCALSQHGDVYCWGMEQVNGRAENTTTAYQVEGLPRAVALSSGHVNSCILDDAGAVWCWGLDLQASVTARHAVVGGPVRVIGLPPASLIASGHLHSCAVARVDGAVWCWGANAAGELGDGSTTDRAMPVRAGQVLHATSISAGINNTCATDAKGDVYCWGTDLQTDTGVMVNQKVPAHIELPEPVSHIVNGRNFFCGLTIAKSVLCFGSNILNQLGDTDLGPTYAIGQPKGVAGVVEIGTGGFFACALMEAGRVKCWGRLPGNDSPDHEGLDPQPVAGIDTATGLGVGAATACVVERDGRVLCWGNNQTGQTGNGRTSDFEPLPVAVKGLPTKGSAVLQSSGINDQPQGILDRAATDNFLRRFVVHAAQSGQKALHRDVLSPAWWSGGPAHGQFGASLPE